MKIGRHFKTTAFGETAERYCASLYEMDVNPRNERRPDLLSNGRAKPFSMEVKSSTSAGVLVVDQLVYGLETLERCQAFFGEQRGRRIYEKTNIKLDYDIEGITDYYLFIHRTDDTSSDDFYGDFANLGLTYGKQYIVPSELIFPYFCSSISTHNDITMGKAVSQIKKRMKESLTGDVPDYLRRTPESWVNFPFSSLQAIFEEDTDVIRNRHQEETFKKFMGWILKNTNYSHFKRLEIVGPKKSEIRVIYDPKNYGNVRKLVNSLNRRKKSLERVIDERKWFFNNVLRKRGSSFLVGNNYGGKLSEEQMKEYEESGVDLNLLHDLERLSQFRTKKEWKQMQEVPF